VSRFGQRASCVAMGSCMRKANSRFAKPPTAPTTAAIISACFLIFDSLPPIFTAKTLDFCGKALENSATSQVGGLYARPEKIRMMRGRTQS